MKNFLFLSSVLLIGCSSVDTVNCPDCAKAPTSILIPNAHNVMHADTNLEKELSQPSPAVEEKVVILPVITTPLDNKTSSADKVQAKNSVTEKLNALSAQAKKKWGEDGYAQSSKHRLVKYLDDYTTRSDIQFDTGKITISTISSENPKSKLREAIIQTVLMPQNPKWVNVFNANQIAFNQSSSNLLFLNQILDQDGQAIEWQWRATRFADFLIENNLQQKSYNKGTANFVEINLVQNHMDLREQIYAKQIQDTAQRYNFPQNLVNAVIKTESSFNPFSMSYGGAIGLMQIVPETAGKDVFTLVKQSKDLPSLEYFLDPNNNIDTGTAYLSILNERYLQGLNNSTSRYYAMISAYNSGTSSVLSVFDLDKNVAIEKINQKDPSQVYDSLVSMHPSKDARAYLQKVTSLANRT